MEKSIILEKLKIMKSLDPDLQEFGADLHEYRLNPPLSEDEVSKFEKLIGIKLPEEYRSFLLNIGNGGSGPSLGVYGLGDVISSIRNYGFKPENLSMEFPFMEAWHMKDPFPTTGFTIKSPMQGTIPICHRGYGMLTYLVIKGAETGHIWDFPSENFAPLIGKDGKRLDFAEWYMNWLDSEIIRLREKRGLTASGEINENLRWNCPICGYSNLNQYENCFRCYYYKTP